MLAWFELWSKNQGFMNLSWNSQNLLRKHFEIWNYSQTMKLGWFIQKSSQLIFEWFKFLWNQKIITYLNKIWVHICSVKYFVAILKTLQKWSFLNSCKTHNLWCGYPNGANLGSFCSPWPTLHHSILFEQIWIKFDPEHNCFQ